jgi:cellulose synthase/poly-beta-1,6-N-acetylglucosamine synthase-like glycosyltransferase
MDVLTTIPQVLFWTSLAVVCYVYFGYPALLLILNKATGGRPVSSGQTTPSVTLIISAFNEERVLTEKLRNSLALDYPPDRLEILVVSDASDDRTDEIAENFVSENVRLLRMTERSGKTVGLNAAVPVANGEILVFSDANAMYRRDAVRALVRNFADASVGAVVGESTYSKGSGSAEESESLYWRYETAIKKLESALGSVVGGDGAIYAIRKQHYRPMKPDALSDFVNPCQIVQLGYRCVYAPDAICVEEAAGSFQKEFARKVRIVNRAWRATMSMKTLMNPIRHGFFSLQLVSHKVLRWLVPLFLFTAFVANGMLIEQHAAYAFLFGLQVLFYGAALAGMALRHRQAMPKILLVPYYFCLVNAASARGILQAYRGETYTTWSTARS